MGGYTLRSTPVGAAAATPLETVCAYGIDSVTWRAQDTNQGGGLSEVLFTANLPTQYSIPCLRRGSIVELMDGAESVGKAILTEPGVTDTGLQFTATGLYREAAHYLCLDSSGNSTTKVSDAVVQAIASGLPWTYPSVPPFTVASTTNGLNYLDALLGAYADEIGRGWMLDTIAYGSGCLVFLPPVTSPTWVLVPGVVDFAPADDDFANVLKGRFIDSTNSNAYATTTVMDAASAAYYGPRQFGVDMTPLGPIMPTRAQMRLQSLLARGKARLNVTDRVEVTSYQLLTPDGAPADLMRVRPGDLVRAHGVNGDALSLNNAAYFDFIIGEVNDTQNAQSITIAAVDLPARTLGDVFAFSSPTPLAA